MMINQIWSDLSCWEKFTNWLALRETFLKLFPTKPSKKSTMGEIEKGIKEGNYEAYSAFAHLLFGDAMMELMFQAIFQNLIDDVIAEHAGSSIDAAFYRFLNDSLSSGQTFRQNFSNAISKKTHGRKEDREDATQLGLMQMREKWYWEKPYLELVEKVVGGEFSKILPRVMRNKSADMKREEEDFVFLDAEVKDEKGDSITMRERLERKHPTLQTQPQDESPCEADPYDALVADIKDKLGDDVAKTAKVYLEIYFLKKIKKKVKKQQVARALRKDRETVSRHIKKIEKFLRERMKKINF